jgi:hypothetical protein
MKIKFVKQDLWVGLYWKREYVYTLVAGCGVPTGLTTWYLCLIPCFPIIWQTKGLAVKPKLI